MLLAVVTSTATGDEFYVLFYIHASSVRFDFDCHALGVDKVPVELLAKARAGGEVEEKVDRMVQIHEQSGDLLGLTQPLVAGRRLAQVSHGLDLAVKVLEKEEHDDHGQREQELRKREAQQHDGETPVDQVVPFQLFLSLAPKLVGPMAVWQQVALVRRLLAAAVGVAWSRKSVGL